MIPSLMNVRSAIHRLCYKLTGGAIGGGSAGMPILLLRTTGRKTRRPRTTPLLYVTDGENIVVVASNGGRPRHPHWWLNLEENPEAAVQVRHQKRWVRAEEAIGEERERLRRPPRDIPQVRRVSEGYHAKDPGGGSAAPRVGRALESGNSGACSGRWRSWRAASGSRRRAGRLRRRALRSS